MGGSLEIFNLAWKFQDLEFFQSLGPYPKDPDILKTVRVVNLLSVVNLLRVLIHYWKCSESLRSVLIYSILSSESLRVVNLLRSSKTLRNQTPYWKQYGRVLWVGVSKIFSTLFARHQFSGPFWGSLRIAKLTKLLSKTQTTKKHQEIRASSQEVWFELLGDPKCFAKKGLPNEPQKRCRNSQMWSLTLRAQRLKKF